MLDRINSFIRDKEFRFTVYEDKIHIINYHRIITLEKDLIKVSSKKEKIIIQGNNFALNKLIDKEILISGVINSLEVIYE